MTVTLTPDKSFTWVPGRGPRRESLARMRGKVALPKEPMGEAWFMGARREMFTYLRERPIDELTERELAVPLGEIASGNSCFGPMREWKLWLDYFATHLVPICLRPSHRSLQEVLCTAVMAQYHSGFSDGPYREFGDDLLDTIGQCLMDESKWNGTKPVLERMLYAQPSPHAIGWGWWEASGDLSASLFFCLKYLRPVQVRAWVESVLAISDPHWRAQLLVWLAGARRIIVDGRQPKEVFMQSPQIDWEGSHVLEGNYTGDYERPGNVPLVPEANCLEFRRAIQESLTSRILDEWRRSIAAVDYLLGEAGHIVNSDNNEFRL